MRGFLHDGGSERFLVAQAPKLSIGLGTMKLSGCVRVIDDLGLREICRQDGRGWRAVSFVTHEPIGCTYKYCDIEEMTT